HGGGGALRSRRDSRSGPAGRARRSGGPEGPGRRRRARGRGTRPGAPRRAGARALRARRTAGRRHAPPRARARPRAGARPDRGLPGGGAHGELREADPRRCVHPLDRPPSGGGLIDAGHRHALAVGQGLAFLLLAPLAGLRLAPLGVLGAVGVMVVIAFGLTNLGLLIAWRIESTQGFHAIMNLLLIPIWLLSGAFFPPAGVPAPLAWLMRLA